MEHNFPHARDFINIGALKVSREETSIKHLSPKSHLLKFWCIEHPYLKQGVRNKQCTS